MLSRQYPLVLFASTLIVALTNGTGSAFTITPSNPSDVEFYREQSFAQVSPSRDATTVIDKSLWYRPLRRGGTFSFNTALNLWSVSSQLGLFGWEFQRARNDLKGSFEILTYQACNLADDCGGASTPISEISPSYRGVGSLFHLKYNPDISDPQPGQGKLHWIQVVQANYGRDLPGVPFLYGIPFVDNGGRNNTPYYDYPGYRFAGEDFFMDRAYAGGISNARRNTYFTAQLFLVEETTPLPGSQKRTATIYNGIRWGWKNTVSRRSCPTISTSSSECPPPPPPPPCNGGSGGGGCNLRSTHRLPDNESPDQELSDYSIEDTNWTEDEQLLDYDIEDANWTFDEELSPFDEYNNSELPVSTPESTSALALLTLGAWGIMKAMKIRLEK